MNPITKHSVSLVGLVRSIFQHRSLIAQLIRRDVAGRYKGSLIGLGWSFFNPVLMLVVYTFVFSVVFKARWGQGSEEGHTEFAVVLFAGLIIHSLFSEIINRAPGLIPSHVNYVKKVIFPLEVLPIVTLGTALFHFFVSVFVLLGAFVILNGFVFWTALLIPLVALPLLIVTLGFAWILASLGVYIRDVSQVIGVVTTVMLFLSPVFYPISVLPEKYHIVLMMNPLTFILEQARAVLIYGQLPDWQGLALYGAVSLLVMWVGFWWFQKTRRGFADVL